MAGQRVQVGFGVGDLVGEVLDAPCQAAQRGFGAGGGVGQVGAWPEPAAGGDQRLSGERGEGFAECGGCGDDEGFELVERGGAGFDRAVERGAQGGDRGGGADPGFGGRVGLAGEDGVGGVDRVLGVGLSLAAAGMPVGLVDLEPPRVR